MIGKWLEGVVLKAGTALIGKVRLVDSGGDEITEATGHSVQAKLIAGTAIAGKVGIDSTTPGTTDRVTANVDKIGGTSLTGRDISLDLKALSDDSIKGLLKSVGDVAATENLIARLGLTTDAVVVAGAAGSVSAKLRRATQGLEDLKSLIVLAAGSNLIGKVSEPATVETPFTGSGDLAVGTNKIAPAAAFKLTEIQIHLNAAPTTGSQSLVITKDDGVGSAYDVVILSIDLVANAVTDLIIKPNWVCKAADVITAAWTNTDTKTYGLIFKHQLL